MPSFISRSIAEQSAEEKPKGKGRKSKGLTVSSHLYRFQGLALEKAEKSAFPVSVGV